MDGCTLYIGQKRYSSWSLRPWILMKALRIPFTEAFVPVEGVGFNPRLLASSPSGLLPLLQLADKTAIWDSLAIAEFLYERCPAVWPADAAARALARCVSAEMHSGFPDVRAQMSFHLGFELAAPLPLEGKAAAQVARIEQIWRECRERFGAPSGAGPFLFGAFSAADAMYAPVVFRFATYRVALGCKVAKAYAETMLANEFMQEWRAAALRDAAAEATIAHYDAHLAKLGGVKL